MRRFVSLAVGFVSLAALGAHGRAASSVPTGVGRTVAVNVTCPGPENQRAAVQPWNAQLQVGDSILWNLVEPILSDTIMISLKDSLRTWPFASPARPRGKRSAGGQRALVMGTYAYNITLRCPVGGGPPAFIVIDPEFIIGG
ncbi:MAG: hypothetical protein HY700_05055 [Gemmatimonadetes bacterium]|nr:hypothetical protein [Gemmatimonadota bacterium]